MVPFVGNENEALTVVPETRNALLPPLAFSSLLPSAKAACMESSKMGKKRHIRFVKRFLVRQFTRIGLQLKVKL
jgi:hypothetical protein